MFETFKAAIEFNALGITVSLPDFTTIFDRGIGAALGWLLSFAFMGLLAIWVTFSIVAAYKITRSGMEKELEEGMTLIKNVWISATAGLLFFAVISVVGSFIGVGNFTQWNYTLAQCHDASGGFYFMDVAAQEVNGLYRIDPTTGAENPVQCCKVVSVDGVYEDAGFKPDTYHYIIDPQAGAFTECEDFE
jgi:hypothetical protein